MIDVEPTPESMLTAFQTWYNDNVADFDIPDITVSECYVVWFCYTVGNAKCLISTDRPDHMYYELTYHLEKRQLHVDMYTKIRHESIAIV